MAQPVWVLSVDLQTKTATFTSGLSDAAKSARSSFGEIRDSAKDMGDGVGEATGRVGGHMMEARHGVMMLGEEFGVHLPRGITTFIASIGPVGAAMEAAFPFLAIMLGATLLIEHLEKVGEAGRKAAESQNRAFDSSAKSLQEATVKTLELKLALAELEGGPTTALVAKLRAANDIMASMHLNPELKKEFEDLSSGVQVPSLWNPLNWVGQSRDASKEVKAEAQSAANAIAGAVTLEEKRAQAYSELTRAQLSLSAIQKSGNQQAVEDQQKLIRLLQDTAHTMDRDVEGQKLGNKLKDEENADKEARKQEAIYNEQQHGLERRETAEINYNKHVAELAKKAAEDKSRANEIELRSNEGFAAALMEQAKERDKLAAEMGKESIENSRKMADLRAAAEEEQSRHKLAGKTGGGADAERLAAEIKAENDKYQIQQAAFQQQEAALDKNGKDYQLKLKQLYDKEEELTRAHENKITEIKNKALEDQSKKEREALASMETGMAHSLQSVLMGHRSFASEMRSIEGQLASSILAAAIAEKNGLESTKMDEAKAAARKMYLAGAHFPWPLNVVMAPALGALGFATMMAFEEGGIVPGTGRGDTVPAMLTPGEAVIPKQMTENLSRMSDGGGGGDTHHYHVRYAPKIHALDGASVERVLQAHSDKFMTHFRNEVRRRNG
jgi:hypothetical protein